MTMDLPSRPPETEEHWCELCGDSLTTLLHDAAIGWYRNCTYCGSDYAGAWVSSPASQLPPPAG